MPQPNPQIDQFLLEGCMRCSLGATPACKVLLWTDILEFLRQLILETELQEERKWGVPTYSLINYLLKFPAHCNLSNYLRSL
ncbi:MAG: DUF1801 domain-containing protein [Bacteroidetes bacterium]|nr:DUF1801 domain-containing protein [Bacteroidota bacterium]